MKLISYVCLLFFTIKVFSVFIYFINGRNEEVAACSEEFSLHYCIASRDLLATHQPYQQQAAPPLPPPPQAMPAHSQVSKIKDL